MSRLVTTPELNLDVWTLGRLRERGEQAHRGEVGARTRGAHPLDRERAAQVRVPDHREAAMIRRRLLNLAWRAILRFAWRRALRLNRRARRLRALADDWLILCERIERVRAKYVPRRTR